MNRRLLVFCTTVLLAGLLTACGGKASTPSSTASPSQVETTPASPSATASASPSASPQASPSEETEPSATPEPTEVAKTYRMNKNYFIVPIDKEKTDNKVVLLTFDDGPKDHITLDPILDTLDKHNAKAIFFVNGYRVKANPDLLKVIDERNQVIGNHSWDHISLKKENEAKIKDQIESVQTIVKEVTGKTPVFFRPPFGAGNDAVRKITKDNGMLFMTWSNGSLDWDMNKTAEDKRPQAVIDNVMEQLHPGSNILMHELPWTAKTLDNLLTQLEEKGYSFVDPNAIDTEL
ncbi:polysaccharide deacetylase family protein [Cohnella mopanensis]|uniref:polysaccharide deacetylase family protein n=1 Tax=Cohnella mopanensis TaxID=2911966 RepID=UPI001EF99754|nr:polysaccharide deacetylase family protein [Cohnella mopanensis]